MKKYRYTQHGLGHLQIGGKDHLLEHGDVVELPADDGSVKEYVALGYLVEVKDHEVKAEPIKAGDVVVLADGTGEKMTVKKATKFNATCTWFEGEEVKEQAFKVELLRRAD